MSDSNNQNPTLVSFVHACRDALASEPLEAGQLALIKPALVTLLRSPDWLPASHRRPREDRYAQYPVYVAPDNSFSVVSFVWKPGQWTPIHDHTVWGVIGIYQGVERTEVFEKQQGRYVITRTIDSQVGEVGAVSPEIGDVHRVGNVSDDVSISIHVYGGNIGEIERHVFEEDGSSKAFISGYEPAPLLIAS